MASLLLRAYHQELGACFGEVNGMDVVEHYGNPLAEYTALHHRVGVLDLSFRGRLCLLGADRKRFLHGQVTNDVNGLATGEGCYAALTTAKGKMQSDLNIYCLPDELLLDFEPGVSAVVAQRLEKYIIADDVQVIDVSTDYGLLSAQGPEAATVIRNAGFGLEMPARELDLTRASDAGFGEIVCVSHSRGSRPGFDLFVPALHLRVAAEKLVVAAKAAGGGVCGWQALETARIEAGIPRFGADMDETNLPPETGIEDRMVSYTKGCYIGQEVIARIRTYGQPAKTLRKLRLADELSALPRKGDKLFHGEKEAGYITSAMASPSLKENIALGYVRREFHQPETELRLRSAAGERRVVVR